MVFPVVEYIACLAIWDSPEVQADKQALSEKLGRTYQKSRHGKLNYRSGFQSLGLYNDKENVRIEFQKNLKYLAKDQAPNKIEVQL